MSFGCILLCTPIICYSQVQEYKGGPAYTKDGVPLFNTGQTPHRRDPKIPAAVYEAYPNSYKLSKLGEEALNRKEYASAKTLFTKALALYKGNLDCVLGLGEASVGLGNLTEATKYYQRIVFPPPSEGSSMSSDPIIRLQYAIVLSRSHNWDKAVSLYKDAIARIPIGGGDKLPYQKFVFKQDEIDSSKLEAIANIQIGLRDPRHRALSKEEKLEHFKEAARLEPNLAIAQFYYGYGLEHVGKNSEAKAAYQKAVRLSEPNSYLNSQAKEFEKTAGQKGWNSPPVRIGFVPAKKP